MTTNKSVGNNGDANDVDQIAFLLSEFTARIQGGEQLEIDQFAAQYVEYADELRRLLPTARALAGLAGVGDTTTPVTEPPLSTLGDFHLIREVGRGGMGIVYEAKQISLNRRVALKVLPFATVLDPNQLRRFHNEARAAAGLHHPNIVPVYSVGCERGVNYYAMQFVDGSTLAEFIMELRDAHGKVVIAPSSTEEIRTAENLSGNLMSAVSEAQDSSISIDGSKRAVAALEKQQTSYTTQSAFPRELTDTRPFAAFSTGHQPNKGFLFRRIAELGAQAAEALDYAHQQGIVHRDIKPANLLVDAQGNVWIADFGLARIGTDANLTMTGDLVGTLRYMSPEQILAQRPLQDHRTDIYSLGATLFELLTLEPAFPDADRHALLRKIPEGVTRPARSIRPDIPIDLETIVLKAINTVPDHRYQTAAEFGKDLRRYLHDEPIRAKRPTLAQAATKWSRRHKTVVRSASIFLLLSIVGLLVGTVLIARERSIAQKAAASEKESAEMARFQKSAAERERDAARYNLYVADMHLAHQAWTTGQVSRMLELLHAHLPKADEVDMRGWEWRYLMSLSRQNLATLDVNSSGIRSLCWSPDGRYLAIGGEVVRIWDARDRKIVMTLPRATTRIPGITGSSCNVSWRPDGHQLITASDKVIKVWDVETGDDLITLGPFESHPRKICCSPNGQFLAIAGQHGSVVISPTVLGMESIVLKGSVTDVWSLAWSPDGMSLAVGGNHKGNLDVWETTGWKLQKSFRAHQHVVAGIAWSPDNRFLATGSHDQQLKIWETSEWTLSVERRAQTGVLALAWSLDGKSLAISGEDSTIQIWQSEEWTRINTLRGHVSRVMSVAWSPNEQMLVSGGSDGTLKFWAPFEFQDAQEVNGSRPAVWSPDGRLIIANEYQRGFAHLFDSQTRNCVKKFEFGSIPNFFFAFEWSPVGNVIAAGGGGVLRLFDADTGRELWKYVDCHISTKGDDLSEVRSIDFSPDGSRLVSTGTDMTIKIWEPRTGHLLETVKGHTASLGSVLWSPDGKRLASKDWDQNVKIWDTSTWREILQLQCHPSATFAADMPYSIAWSPDGSELAAGTSEGSLIVWDSTTGRERLSINGHASRIRSISWSPDGSRIASGGGDRRIRIWDVRTGRELLNLEGHATIVETVSWSPDGRKLLTGCPADLLPLRQEPCIRIWDATRGFEDVNHSE